MVILKNEEKCDNDGKVFWRKNQGYVMTFFTALQKITSHVIKWNKSF